MFKFIKLPIILAVVALFIIITSLYIMFKLDPGNKKSADIGQKNASETALNIGGEFTLIDMNKNIITEKSLNGKYTLMYFGFTYCPDICPTTLNVISSALSNLNEFQRKKIQAFFVSVDYERDSPENLKDYLNNFDPLIIGMTGDIEHLTELSKNYKVYFMKTNNDKNSEYLLDHSSIIYLFDESGKYLKHFTVKSTPEQLYDSLNELL